MGNWISFEIKEALKKGSSLDIHEALRSGAFREESTISFEDYWKSVSLSVKDRNGDLPLHIALRNAYSFTVVELIFLEYPKAAEVQNNDGYLPLHIALDNGASSDTIRMLFKSYPKAARIQDKNGDLPLHIALRNEISSCVVKDVFQEYPKAAKVHNNIGLLPLHIALEKDYCFFSIPFMLLEAHPKSVQIQDKHGRSPLHRLHCSEYYVPSSVPSMLKAYPEILSKSDDWGCLPIHAALGGNAHAHAHKNYILSVLKTYPKAVKVQDAAGRLPLHTALFNGACVTVVKIIYDPFPEAIMVQDNYGNLPLHYAAYHNYSPDFLALIINGYPDGVKMKNQDGYLPIHFLCNHFLFREPDEPSILRAGKVGRYMANLELLISAYPESIEVKGKDGNSPSVHIKTNIVASIVARNLNGRHNLLLKAVKEEYSQNLVKLLLQAFPESSMFQDDNGMVALHHACESKVLFFLDNIIAILDANPACLAIQDHLDRTPFELLSGDAYSKVKKEKLVKEMLLVHHLTTYSSNLSEKALRFLVNMFPDNITTLDKYGMLPFHRACLNPTSKLEVLMYFLKISPEVVSQ
jgi:ankyrin repeat protein